MGRLPFLYKFSKKINPNLRIDLKSREMGSKVIFGHPSHQSSEMGGGGGASQWPACKPFGDMHSICPWSNTPVLVVYRLQRVMIDSSAAMKILRKSMFRFQNLNIQSKMRIYNIYIYIYMVHFT